jgi:hypothetical protein
MLLGSCSTPLNKLQCEPLCHMLVAGPCFPKACSPQMVCVQIHLLWVGHAIPPHLLSFVRRAAHVLSPAPSHLSLAQPLDITVTANSDGTSLLTVGGLGNASQDIALISIAQATQSQRTQICNYVADTHSVPKGAKAAVQPMRIPNTATCWFVYDSQEALKPSESSLESITASFGAPFLTGADLALAVGDTNVNSEALLDDVLRLHDATMHVTTTSEEIEASLAMQAATEIRMHLLRACSIEPPTMCATCANLRC